MPGWQEQKSKKNQLERHRFIRTAVIGMKKCGVELRWIDLQKLSLEIVW